MTRFASLLAALALLSAPGFAAAQKTELTIADLSIGFGFGPGSETSLKLGHWVPVDVSVQAKNGAFAGELRVSTQDGEQNETTIVIPNVAFADSGDLRTQHFYGVLKFGRQELSVHVDLVDSASGRVAASRDFQINSGGRHANITPASTPLVVYFGTPAGMYDVPKKIEELHPDNRVLEDKPSIARLQSERVFPTQWFGYGGVDAFVLPTGDANFFDRLDPQRQSALRTWVRQGGHLVVSVAKNWQLVKESFLGPMLPAKLAGVDEVDSSTVAGELLRIGSRSNDSKSTPFDAKKFPKIAVAKLTDVRGVRKVETSGSAKRPLVVVGSYGLGRVTLLAWDAEESPVRDWQDASRFWINCFDLDPAPSDPNFQQQRQWGYRRPDYAQVLATHLEDFPEVTVVPFGYVALLIFLYILLIGPVDYFFLKKVVKRLELTWITFPTWVVVISVAAYYSAYLLKGDDLRLNRVELVDVDAASQTLRGTGFVGVFSPQIARYDVSYTPSLADAGKWSDLPAGVDGSGGTMGRDQVVSVGSWQAVPDDSPRGLGGEGSASLLGRKQYRYDMLADGEILGVGGAPIQVWSVKTFTGQWLGKAAPTIDAKLKGDPNNPQSLRGTIANLLPVTLEKVVLVFGAGNGGRGGVVDTSIRAWQIERLGPNQTVDLSSLKMNSLDELLKDGNHRQSDYRSNPYDASVAMGSGGVDGLVRNLAFRLRGRGAAIDSTGNFYLSGLNLSHQLDVGRAIVLARVAPDADAVGGELWLNPDPDKPPKFGGKAKQSAAKSKKKPNAYFLRVVLPTSRENE